MKNQITSKSLVSTVCVLLMASLLSVRAQNGTWINGSGGTWATAANWQNGIVADGIGNTASFNAVDIVTNLSIVNPITVTIDDFARTNSNLVFADLDTNTPASWSLTGAGLTAPTNFFVTVSNLAPGQSVNISAPIADIADLSFVPVPSSLVKLGNSTLILSGGNSYSGGTVVSNGTLQINADSGLGAAGTDLSLQGGTFVNNGSLTLTLRPIIFGASNVTWNQGGSASANNGGDLTGVITNAGGGTIFKTGTGNLRFGNNTANFNTFTNPIVISAGNFQAVGNNNTNPFGSGPITVSNNLSGIFGASSGNNVFISNNIIISPGITLNFDAVGGTGAGQTTGLGLFGNISGSGNMQKGGGGNGTFGGDNSGFTGTFTGTASGAGNFSFASPSAGSASATWIFNNTTTPGTGGWPIQAHLGAAGGTIQFGSIGGSGTLPLNKNTDAGNVIFEIGALNQDNVINFPVQTSASGGTLGLNKVGSGSLTLNNANNNYNGPTTIKNGVLVVTNENRLGAVPASFTANQLTLDGGALSNYVSMVLSNDNRGITLGTVSGLGGAFSPGAGTSLTISNVITGDGSLTLKNTSGTLFLYNANIYTGKTFINSGVLAIAVETALGNNPASFTADQLTLNGGTLSNTAPLTINNSNRGLTLGAAGGTFNTDGGTLTIANPIAGGSSGVLNKSGAGVLLLAGANSYSGNTFINGGTLSLGSAGSIANSTVISVNATFDVSAVSGGFTLASGQTLSGNGMVSGNVTIGTGATVNAGNSIGQINIAGNVTFSGGTNLVEINSATNDIVNISGNLNLTGVSTIQLGVQSGLSSGRRVLMRYTGSLSGGGNFVLVGAPAGTTIDTSIAHEVAIVLNVVAANVSWKGDGSLNNWDTTSFNWSNTVSTAIVQYSDGNNVTFNDTGSQTPAVNITASVLPNSTTVNATSDYTLSGPGRISGVGALTKTNSGTLTLLTANDYSGATMISQGVVQVGNGSTSGSLGSGDVTDNGALNFNLPVGVTNAGAIHGAGSLNLQGGKLVLTGDGDFSGATVINASSTLQIGAGGSSGSLGGGSVVNSGALVWNRTGSVTNSSVISGGGSLSVSNNETVALAGDSPTYSGSVGIDTGVLQIGVGGTNGSIGVASVTVANNGGIAFSRSDTVTNGITLVGTGRLIQQGPGVLILTNTIANNGTTIINAGTLQIGDGGADGTLSGGPVTDNGILAFNRSDSYVVTNRITGSGSVRITGGGTNTLGALSPYNSYLGGTVVSNATVVVGTNADVNSLLNNVGGGPITLYNGGTLNMANSANLTTSSTILWAFPNDLIIPAGQTGTVLMARDMRAASIKGQGFGGSVSGAGTLNFQVNGPREDISGDWSGFTGVLNIVTNQGADNFNTTASIPNATVNIGDGTRLGVWSEAGTPNGNFSITLGAVTGVGQLGSPVDSQTAVGGTFIVGGLGATNQFDGVIANQGGGLTSIVKSGAGEWILTGVSSYTGTTTVSNGVLALATNSFGVDADISSSSSITIVSPGVLDMSGSSTGTLNVNTTLAGNGTVRGGVQVNNSIAPGISTNVFGNLTITSNLVVYSTANFKIDHLGSAVSDEIICTNVTFSPGTVINVTQPGTNNLQTGDVFRLFSAPISADFVAPSVSLILPANNIDGSITYVWTNRLAIDGTIVLLSGAAPTVNTTPAPISTLVQGNKLILSWAADHTGWGLQVQTNLPGKGIGTNWTDVPGVTSGDSITNIIDPTYGSVFYRLIYPPNVP